MTGLDDLIAPANIVDGATAAIRCKAIARAASRRDKSAVPFAIRALDDEEAAGEREYDSVWVRAVAIRALAYLDEKTPEIIDRLRLMIGDVKYPFAVATAAVATLIDFGVFSALQPPSISIPFDKYDDFDLLESPELFAAWAAGEMIDKNAAKEIAVPILLNRNASAAARCHALGALTRFGRMFAGLFIDILCNHDESEHLRSTAKLAVKDLGFTIRRGLFGSSIRLPLRQINRKPILKPNLIEGILQA